MHLLIHDHSFRPIHPALVQTDYTSYAVPKRARADELLVRSVAAQMIGRAHSIFGGRIREWRQRYINPKVISQQRAHGHQIATFHQLLHLHDRFLVAEAGIRTMTTSLDPMVWHHIHTNADRRLEMAQLDHHLLDAVYALQHAAQTIDFALLRHETKCPEHLCTSPMMEISNVIAKRVAFFTPASGRSLA
jgi:hypothetical protein